MAIFTPTAATTILQTKLFGVRVGGQLETDLFEELKSVFNLKSLSEFIGCHPVPVSSENINFLINNDYFVCEKSDGIRVMLLCYKKIVYLYDRKNCFYITKYLLDDERTYLLDGEIYSEMENYIFSMFDCLIYESNSVISANFQIRFNLYNKFKDLLRNNMLKQRNDMKTKRFYIIAKGMFRSYGLKDVLNEIKNLKHENDGLIFTPLQLPYVLGIRSEILK